MEQYMTVLKKYAEFSGRARRKEYWMFILINFIISTVLSFVFGFLSRSLEVTSLAYIPNLYSLAVALPTIAAGIRRMHDIGKSGWFLLIPIYNIVLLATDSQPESNEYGPNPKA